MWRSVYASVHEHCAICVREYTLSLYTVWVRAYEHTTAGLLSVVLTIVIIIIVFWCLLIFILVSVPRWGNADLEIMHPPPPPPSLRWNPRAIKGISFLRLLQLRI